MTKRTPNLQRVLEWHPTTQQGEAYRTTAEGVEDGGGLTAAEVDAIVTLAQLMVIADDRVSDDEFDVFEALTAHLANGDGTAAKRIAGLVRKLDDAPRDPESIEARARAAATELKRPSAKAIGYKAAYLTRVWDLDANPDEDDLDDLLIEALALSPDEAKELAQQVNEALMVG